MTSLASPRPIGLAVIGLGGMGRVMLEAAAAHPDFAVRHISDVSEYAVQAASSHAPAATCSTDPLEALRDQDIEAVYIATPPKTHADLAVGALQRGHAVMSEKPLAVALEDGRRMVSAARQAGRPAFVNFSLSDRRAVLHIEKAVRSGRLGEIRGVDVRCTFPSWPRSFQTGAAWLLDPDQGGFVREVLSHYIYLTARLVGPLAVEHTLPTYGTPVAPTETSLVALLRAGDVPVSLGARIAAGPESYEWTIFGSHRSYRLTDWTVLSVTSADRWRRLGVRGEPGSPTSRLSRFAEAIRTGVTRDLASFEEAMHVQHLVEDLVAQPRQNSNGREHHHD